MITYVIKSSLSLLILFGLYWFLLRKEKLFVFNRFFLVASVVFSLIVPFISIPVNFQVTPQLAEIIPSGDFVIPEISTLEFSTIASEVSPDQTFTENQPEAINFSTILLVLYISGVIFFLVRFLKNIYIIIRRTRLSNKISFDGYRVVMTNDKTGPCCFFRSIFLNRDDYLKGRIAREILDHELEHIRQSHTVDIILIELVKIFYWFNPVHILYERAIRINHEYLADNGVISDKSDVTSYADKLLSFITGRSNMSLTSSSNHSFTKKRLIMMMKPGSGRFIYGARIAITLCLGTTLFLLLSFKESNKQPLQPDLSGMGTEVTGSVAFTMDLTIELEKNNVPEKDVYVRAEIMPQYPGGDTELRKFIATNVNYPEAAREQKAKGTVIVRFVVNTKGNIEDVQIMQRVHPAIDAEVLKIVGKLQQFTPGSQGGKPVKVYYTVPVTFTL